MYYFNWQILGSCFFFFICMLKYVKTESFCKQAFQTWNIPHSHLQKYLKNKTKEKVWQKFLYPEQPAAKTAKEVDHGHSRPRTCCLKETIKDFKVRICIVLRKHENNVSPKEEWLPHISKGKERLNVTPFYKTVYFLWEKRCASPCLQCYRVAR